MCARDLCIISYSCTQVYNYLNKNLFIIISIKISDWISKLESKNAAIWYDQLNDPIGEIICVRVSDIYMIDEPVTFLKF